VAQSRPADQADAPAEWGSFRVLDEVEPPLRRLDEDHRYAAAAPHGHGVWTI
jgi:hypothetical protein